MRRPGKAECEGCGNWKPQVMGCAFQRDGKAIFRHLCASCERRERGLNQPGLFAGMVFKTAAEAVEVFESATVVDERQMGLFTTTESGQY